MVWEIGQGVHFLVNEVMGGHDFVSQVQIEVVRLGLSLEMSYTMYW